MNIIATFLVGLLVGAVAKLLMPGRDPGGFIITALLGIAGAWVAKWIGQALGWYGPEDSAGFISSVIGAVILLWIYRLVVRRRIPKNKPAAAEISDGGLRQHGVGRTQPPCASTTCRQGVESFALFCSRQARICGALPMNCEQKASASARQAIFSCIVGPLSAEACAMPAMTRAKASAADLIVEDLVMGAPFGFA